VVSNFVDKIVIMAGPLFFRLFCLSFVVSTIVKKGTCVDKPYLSEEVGREVLVNAKSSSLLDAREASGRSSKLNGGTRLGTVFID